MPFEFIMDGFYGQQSSFKDQVYSVKTTPNPEQYENVDEYLDIINMLLGHQAVIEDISQGGCDCNLDSLWKGIQSIQSELSELKDKIDNSQGGDCECDMSSITTEINNLKTKIEGIQTSNLTKITNSINNITDNLWIPEITTTPEGYQTIFKKFSDSNK